jgi:hypothetical protein
MNQMNETFIPEITTYPSSDISAFAHHMVLLARTRTTGDVEKIFNWVKLRISHGADTTADELVQYYYNELRNRISSSITVHNKKHSFN